MAHWVKDPALPLLWFRIEPWRRFDPWPRNLHRLQVQPKPANQPTDTPPPKKKPHGDLERLSYLPKHT